MIMTGGRELLSISLDLSSWISLSSQLQEQKDDAFSLQDDGGSLDIKLVATLAAFAGLNIRTQYETWRDGLPPVGDNRGGRKSYFVMICPWLQYTL